MTQSELAIRLLAMRLKMGISRRDLARKVGLSYQSIAAYEVGRKRVLALTLCAIVAACGWTMVEFFEDEVLARKGIRSASDAELDRRAMAMPTWRADA